jgi:hypothetical protein
MGGECFSYIPTMLTQLLADDCDNVVANVRLLLKEHINEQISEWFYHHWRFIDIDKFAVI